jgi:hypothetical protein
MRWTSYGHEEQGGPIAEKVLKDIGIKSDIVKKIVPIIVNHLSHIRRFNGQGDLKSIRQLAHDLQPATIEELTHLIEADHSGRPPLPQELPLQAQQMRDTAKEQNIYDNIIHKKNLSGGDEIMKFFGGMPGKHVGEVQNWLYQQYLEGKLHPNDVLPHLLKYMKSATWNDNQPVALIRGNDILNVPIPLRKKVLDDALMAQYNGEIKNREEALLWLNNYIQNNGSS